ncbi:MAG TPA: hypothetical protein ENI95_10000 [Chloroflexi bacterium]|nr:hypothetical protein [Chloroflexota bacterium]
MPKPPAPSLNLLKPTLETRFHIDYEWWERSGHDLRLEIQRLCEELSEEPLEDTEADVIVDWIDPETGQVKRVDRLTYLLLSLCSQRADYITERTPLIEAVFRALLATNNRPMTAVELAERIGRPADVILRALAGRRVYKGIRPLPEDA